MSGHPMRGVEGAGAYRTGHPLGGDNGTPLYRFQKKMKKARQAAAPSNNLRSGQKRTAGFRSS